MRPLIREARARLRRLGVHDYRIADDGLALDLGPVRLCASGEVIQTRKTTFRIAEGLSGLEAFVQVSRPPLKYQPVAT